jgi:hypothetical protein
MLFYLHCGRGFSFLHELWTKRYPMSFFVRRGKVRLGLNGVTQNRSFFRCEVRSHNRTDKFGSSGNIINFTGETSSSTLLAILDYPDLRHSLIFIVLDQRQCRKWEKSLKLPSQLYVHEWLRHSMLYSLNDWNGTQTTETSTLICDNLRNISRQ